MIQKTLFLFLAFLLLYSCKSGHVVRNYEYAPPNCDCYVQRVGIATGGYVNRYSFYRFKRKAKCSKINRDQILDSLNLFNNRRFELLETTVNQDIIPDSITLQIAKNDSMVALYNQWTACKVRIKYRNRKYDVNDTVVTIKRKIVFYRRGSLGLRRAGKAKYVSVNDKVVKSRVK